MSTEIIIFVSIFLTAITCALIGNFLVLKKLSLMGDAISHAVLPGIVVAFFVAGSLDSIWFFIFSVIFALLMAFSIQWITDRIRVSKESIIGVVFTFLFALGVILIVQFAANVHLDQDAVLFGQVEFSAWNRLIVFGVDLGPRSLWIMGTVFLINLVMIVLFYKELKITSFDPVFADSLGISSRKMHYLVMFLTAITVVAAFEVVGVILVVAMLIVPAATAYLVSKKLNLMIFLSLFFAGLSSFFGFIFALNLDASIAGSVAMMNGAVLFLVFAYNVLHGRSG